MDDEQKGLDLTKLLRALACITALNPKDDDFCDIIVRFEIIYGSSYRHLYSDIFAVLTSIDAEDVKGSIDALQENVRVVYESYDKCATCTDDEKKEIQQSLRKLFDHINLDASRINYMRKIDQKGEDNKISLINSIETQKKELNTISKNLELKTQDMQKDYTTILGIFASIVLTFVASMVFSTAVLANVEKASIYRILIVVWGLGFILINLLHMLISFINSLNTRGNNNSVLSHFFLNLEKEKKPTFNIKKVNLCFLIVSCVILIAWLIDMKSLRDIITLFLSNKLDSVL